MTITKLTLTEYPKVKNEDRSGDFANVVAFQLFDYSLKYFGATVEGTFDTLIYADGLQVVNGGDGFIPHGTSLATLLQK